MSYQTGEPIRELRMNITARSWGELIHWIQQDEATYDLPYQRGAVWTTDQRLMLIYSILSGTPIPALIVNRRPESMWFGSVGERFPVYAVIDGKQRLMAVRMFMEDVLRVPASWFPTERVTRTQDTVDGPYVRYSGLTRPGQRFFEQKPVPLAEAGLKSVQEEAEVYLRVNGSGTPQSDEDIARATGIAQQGA